MPKIKTQKTTASAGKRTYRKRERKPKSEVAMEIKRKIIAEDRLYYNPTPFWKMTDGAIRCFASRQARQAAKSAPMTDEEMELYAGAIYHSITRFNARDPQHIAHMRYLKELRKQEEERRLAEEYQMDILEQIKKQYRQNEKDRTTRSD